MLGAYDQGRNGLGAPHPVGIFEVGVTTPIVTAMVLAGTASPLSGHFRYVACTPTTLRAGREYIVAAGNYGISFDPYS